MGVAARAGHEFDFTDRDFERVRELIYRKAGISLSSGKRDLVYGRLSRRLRALQLTSFEQYLCLLDSGDVEEWQAFTNALTTNFTSFYREPYHFPMLADHVAGLPRHRPVKVWCTASSTGEEPFTIAMTLVELFNSFSPPVRILATDIDTRALATAQQGIYPKERVENLSEEKRRRFFLRGKGAQEGWVRVRPELTALVTFRSLNLLDARWPMRGPFDAIFCRNVMIYFDKATQLRLLERFAPLLARDGLLFAGHSESLHHAAHLFRHRGRTVYELADARANRESS